MHVGCVKRSAVSQVGDARDDRWNRKVVRMTGETSTRVQIAALIYSMTSAVLFGAGLLLVLTLPVLNADAGYWISVVIGASLILAVPIAWWMAPRLRARHWRLRPAADGAPLGGSATRQP